MSIDILVSNPLEWCMPRKMLIILGKAYVLIYNCIQMSGSLQQQTEIYVLKNDEKDLCLSVFRFEC